MKRGRWGYGIHVITIIILHVNISKLMKENLFSLHFNSILKKLMILGKIFDCLVIALHKLHLSNNSVTNQPLKVPTVTVE